MEAKKHTLVTVFSELFTVDEETVKFLQLSYIGFMNCRCMIRRNGSKASSYKGTEFSQLYKIMKKIAYIPIKKTNYHASHFLVLNIQDIYLTYLLLRIVILEAYNYTVTRSIQVVFSIKLGY